jgi:hypothetical protein
LTTATQTMPRKPKRNDVPVKIDAEVLRLARIVAAYEDLPLAELISETLRPILVKKLEQHQEKKKASRRNPEE